MRAPLSSLFRSAVCVCLFTSLVLSACAPATPTTVVTADLPTAEETAPSTLTPLPTLALDLESLRGIHIQAWHAFSGEAYAVFSEQVALFNTINPWGISIEAAGYGDYLALYESMQAAIETGETPAMVITLPEQALAWETIDLVVDLEAYLGDLNVGLGSLESADFPAAFWEGPGVPALRSARFIFYNQTWAHELGFTSPPQTPDEFRRQSCAANAAFKADADLQNDGLGGWVVDTHWQTVYSWLLAFGGGPVDEEAYIFNTTSDQAALEFVKSLYDQNCAWLPEDWLSSQNTPFDSFADRKALFVTGDLADISQASLSMTAASRMDEWTLLPFPGEEQPVVVAYGPSYIVLRSSPEEQLAAWLFARWTLSAENQALWTESTGLLPLRLSVLDLIGPYRTASPQWEAAAGSLEFLENIPRLASWRMVKYVLEDGMNYIFQGNLPVGQIPVVLDEMQAMADELGNK